MLKTKEELDLLKEEYESLNNKLSELSENELKEVTGSFIDSDDYEEKEAYEKATKR